MRYFLKRLLGLEEEEEEQIQFTAMERGALLHNIFFKFYTTLKEKNLHDQPWNHGDLLKKVARHYIHQLPYHGLFWTLEQEVILGTADRKGLLDTFLEVEQGEIQTHEFRPLFFEYGFGLREDHGETDRGSAQDVFIVHENDREVRLSGKIDRIDAHPGGDILIIDYKTGKGSNPAVKDMAEGLSLQLPVYMAVAKYNLTRYKPVAGIYYRVHDTDNCTRTVVIVDSERHNELLKRGDGRLPNKKYPVTLEELIRQSLVYVTKHVGNIARGDFSHTRYPDNEKCRTYCPYNKICRKDVAKLSAMDR
jgi:ATP-dependent helicase/DNAse subunit B